MTRAGPPCDIVRGRKGCDRRARFHRSGGNPGWGAPAAAACRSGKVDLIVNTPLGKESFYDEGALRKTALQLGILSVTTLTGANATVAGIEALKRGGHRVRSLQAMHSEQGLVENGS